MINSAITDTGIFLMMPPSTQTLYFHLCTHADDDGVVDAYSIIKMTQSKEDDFAILVAKKFVTVLDMALQLIWINHWFEHNSIRAELINPSPHRELLVSVIPGVPVKESKKDEDTKRRIEARRAVRSGQDADKTRIRTVSAQSPGSSIEKYSLVKTNITTDVATAPLVEKNEVFLSWEETIAPITTTVETQRKSSVTLFNKYGLDNCLKMIRVVAHAHQNQYARKEVRVQSLTALLGNWDKLVIYAKSQSTQKPSLVSV